MQFKFRHQHQISGLYLNKHKSWGKCALCAHPVHSCAPLCTIAHRFFQNMFYKKVYEIQIQAFTPNFNSLA